MEDFEKERVELMEATGLLNINIDRIKELSSKMTLNCLFENVEYVLVNSSMQMRCLLDYVYQRKINFHSALTLNQLINDEISGVCNAIFIRLKDYNDNNEFIKLSAMYYVISEQNMEVNNIINKCILDEQAKREEYDPNEMEQLLVPRKENKKPKTTRKVKKSSK